MNLRLSYISAVLQQQAQYANVAHINGHVRGSQAIHIGEVRVSPAP